VYRFGAAPRTPSETGIMTDQAERSSPMNVRRPHQRNPAGFKIVTVFTDARLLEGRHGQYFIQPRARQGNGWRDKLTPVRQDVCRMWFVLEFLPEPAWQFFFPRSRLGTKLARHFQRVRARNVRIERNHRTTTGTHAPQTHKANALQDHRRR
jgi:hypothetical protein